MVKTLRKIYFTSLAPVVAGFVILGIGRMFEPVRFAGHAAPALFTITVFILSAATCLALPIFIRTVFANSVKEKTYTGYTEFLFFQKKLLYVAMITPWFSLIGYLCVFPRFYLAAVNLMALYAIYYYYPSARRINFDKKIFRVKQDVKHGRTECEKL